MKTEIMHSSYYALQLIAGTQVVHKEIVKVVSSSRAGLDSVSNWQLRQNVLANLFARDSMSLDSPVRAIREKIDSVGGNLTWSIQLGGGEEDYQKEQSLKTVSIGYMYNEPIDAFWFYSNSDVNFNSFITS